MTPDKQMGAPVFRVIGATDGPYFGQLLRLRLVSGGTPTLRDIKGGNFKAKSPLGQETTLKVLGFSLMGGKPSQARFARTGRVDVLALGDDPNQSVSIQWTLTASA